MPLFVWEMHVSTRFFVTHKDNNFMLENVAVPLKSFQRLLTCYGAIVKTIQHTCCPVLHVTLISPPPPAEGVHPLFSAPLSPVCPVYCGADLCSPWSLLLVHFPYVLGFADQTSMLYQT